jgi:transcription antitermination factor NusG
MSLIMNTVFKKSENIAFRKIADEYILVPISRSIADVNSIYSLNEIAGFIWGLLNGRRSVEEVWNEIAREYDVNDDEAREDVEVFLQQLIEIGAIRVK